MSQAYALCVQSSYATVATLPLMEQGCGALKAGMDCFAEHLEEMKLESAIAVAATSSANLQGCELTVATMKQAGMSCDADCSTIYVPENTGGGTGDIVDAFRTCLVGKADTEDACKLYQYSVECLEQTSGDLSSMEQAMYVLGVEGLCVESQRQCDLTCAGTGGEEVELDAMETCLTKAAEGSDLEDSCVAQRAFEKCLLDTKSELDAITFEVYNQMAQLTCMDLPETCELKCDGSSTGGPDDFVYDAMTECLMGNEDMYNADYDQCTYYGFYESCLKKSADEMDEMMAAVYKETLPMMCLEFQGDPCKLDCNGPDPADTKALEAYTMCMEKAMTLSTSEDDVCKFVKDEFICFEAYAPFLSATMTEYTGHMIFNECEETTKQFTDCDFDCGGVKTFVEEEAEKKTGNTDGTDGTDGDVDLSGSSALSQSAMVMAGVAATAVALLF